MFPSTTVSFFTKINNNISKLIVTVSSTILSYTIRQGNIIKYLVVVKFQCLILDCFAVIGKCNLLIIGLLNFLMLFSVSN